MMIVHLTSSPFFGGPERQMLGLAQSLSREYRSAFLAFAEKGKCRGLLNQVQQAGFEGVALQENVPHFRAMTRELRDQLQRLQAGVLCCHGYKANLLGWWAARSIGVPVMSVSHGWTAATWKVRLYEALDRRVLRRMDRVVCVSEGQAAKVRRAGVSPERMVIIRNAVQTGPYDHPAPEDRQVLQEMFAEPRTRIIGAAGRLSPEKGFDQLVLAAEMVLRSDPGVGFVLFGDGPLRQAVAEQIAARGLTGKFILAGFRTDLERFLPHWDLAVLPSYTEGLPVIVLEALAARVPVVATAVGGTPEVIEDGCNGFLVPPGDPAALADRILEALRSEPERQVMGRRGRQRIEEQFTFEAQSVQYQEVFERLTGKRKPAVQLACQD